MPRRHTLVRHLALAALAALTPPGAAAAQRPDSASTDSSESVSRRRGQLPIVLVTGTLSSFLHEGLGVARSVIGPDQLRREPPRTVLDPLRHVVGAFVDEANGPLGPAVVRLRGGEETFTQILMDGVPVNDNGGFLDAQGMTLVNVHHIDVARGPQSALYGSSAVSGVVQVVSRAGGVGPLTTEATLEAGRAASYGGSVRAAVEAAGGTPRVRYAFGAGSLYDRGPYRIPHDLRSHNASGRVDWLAGRSLGVTGVARFLGVNSRRPVRDLGVTRAPLDPNQREARDRYLATASAAWTPGARWQHRLSASSYRRDFTYEDEFDGLDQSQFGGAFVFDANFLYSAVVRRVIGRYVGTVAGRPANALDASLAFGAELQRESLSDGQSGDFGPAGSFTERPSTSLFAEAQARLGRVALLAGSRVERFRDLPAAHVPRALVVVDVLPRHVALRAAVSRAYKAPDIQDQYPNNPFIVANPSLRSETSESWDLGVDVRARPGATAVSVTYFEQVYEDLIRSVDFDSNGRQIKRNLGRSRATGLEADVLATPASGWRLGAHGAWLATNVVDNGGLPSADFPNGEPLPFRPTYTAGAHVGAPLSGRASVVVRTTAVGPQVVLANRFGGPRVTVPSYRLLAATASWTLSPSVAAYVRVDNALNATYATAFDRPGMPRSAVVGVRAGR